jgi:ADP-ribose pyrophosphatase YjhB (NUDIX family)
MKKNDMKYCPKCAQRLGKRIIQNKERIYCSHCDTIFYDNPLPTVAVVARNEKGQLLLVKRGVEPKKGFWALPGGFMDSGESVTQALLREMQEETGLKGVVKNFIGIYNHESEMYGYVIIIIYEVKLTGGALKAGDDAQAAEFFEEKNLPSLAFSFQERAVEKAVGYSLFENRTSTKEQEVYFNERSKIF